MITSNYKNKFYLIKFLLICSIVLLYFLNLNLVKLFSSGQMHVHIFIPEFIFQLLFRGSGQQLIFQRRSTFTYRRIMGNLKFYNYWKIPYFAVCERDFSLHCTFQNSYSEKIKQTNKITFLHTIFFYFSNEHLL